MGRSKAEAHHWRARLKPGEGFSVRRVPGVVAELIGKATTHPLPVLAATFTLTHIIYLGSGLRFDYQALSRLWQFLDTGLLRDRLLESVFFLHTQPPLFNIFAGVILKLFGNYATLAFHGVYLVWGLILYVAVFRLQVTLGISRAIAFSLSTLYMVSPSFVLYEHWLFYTFPLAVLIVLSALFFHASQSGRRVWPVVAFFSAQFLICGVRSIFHIVYYLVLIAALGIIASRQRRKVVLIALVPFAVLLSFYVKNYSLFGKFTTSTWFGTNLWAITGENVTLEDRKSLVAEGELSEIALVKRFSKLEKYPGRYLRAEGFESIPALSRVKKSTGYNNYNHIGYIAIAERNFEDSLYIIAHRPEAYLIGISKSWFCYFKSASDLCFFHDSGSVEKISRINNACDYLCFGKVPVDLTRFERLSRFSERPQHFYLFLLFGLPFLFFYGLKVAWSGMSRGVKVLSREQRRSILYICFLIFYVAFMANMFGAQENNRYRFMTEPLYVVLFGLFLHYSFKPLLKKFLLRSKSLKASVINRVSKGTLGTPS